jgi:uncharacterized protein
MSDHNKEEIFQKLKEMLENKSETQFALIFGSFNESDKYRDIDVAVNFNMVPDGTKFLDLIVELSATVKKEIDLIILNSASAFLRHQVFKTGKLLFKKDDDIYSDFREKTITDYDEYNYISGMNIYDR